MLRKQIGSSTVSRELWAAVGYIGILDITESKVMTCSHLDIKYCFGQKHRHHLEVGDEVTVNSSTTNQIQRLRK